MEGFGSSVWSRRGGDELSRNTFMFYYMGVTLLALLASAIVCYHTTSWIHFSDGKAVWNGPFEFIWLFLGSLIVIFLGVIIALRSDQPAISLVGLGLVAIPFGALLGPTVAMYEVASVVNILIITALIVTVMGAIGAIIPKSLEGFGGFLFGGLLILIAGQFGLPLLGWIFPNLPIGSALGIWDWVGVVLFSAYVVYDVNRALRVPATVDNAIDCALALYLDILNIFVRLLALRGQSRSS